MAGDVYTEWKMLEDGDFWTALHHARIPRRDTGRAMSDENLKFVLDGYGRFNAGEKVPELWFFTADTEFHAARKDPDSAIHRGLEAVRRQHARRVDAYPDLTVEPLEARGMGTRSFSGFALGPMAREAESRWRWSSRT